MAGAVAAHDPATGPLTIDDVAWMQGTWLRTSGELVTEEQWMIPRAGVMLGVSRTVSAGRMVEYEFLILRAEDGSLRYEAHPSGQEPTVFVASTATDSSIVFHAPEHDFPQRVGYERRANGELAAWIEGIRNGAPRRVDFVFVPAPGSDAAP